MLEAVTEQRNGIPYMKLTGVIDDSTSFEVTLGTPPPVLHLDCGQITRVNSRGIKMWMDYFGGARFRGTQLEFFDCSPAIIEQFNLISNFGCGGKVRSLQIPYTCSACATCFTKSFTVDEAKKMKKEVKDQPCPKCKAAGTFDDLPEMYLGFLK